MRHTLDLILLKFFRVMAQSSAKLVIKAVRNSRIKIKELQACRQKFFKLHESDKLNLCKENICVAS